jgi:regulator of protease activity HflC (stomatin/prohibitin superfamily)
MGGISALLSALALLGFLGFLAGIGLVVVAASQGRPVRGGILLSGVGLVAGILFSIIANGILIVEPTQVAVIFNTLSGELETPRRSGTSVVVPVVQTATIYPIQQQEYTMSGQREEGNVQGDDAVRGRTVDGQEVFVDITVIFQIDPQEVNTVHQRWQNRYQDEFIRPTLRGLSRDAISRFRAEDIFGERRTELGESITETMRARMTEEGFILTDLVVRDVSFSPEFSQSIEQRQIAEQNRLRAIEEAERIRIAAQGERDAEIARAEGSAQAVVLNAQAQAEALRLVSEQIAANPSLIQYEYIQNLSDNINLALVPSNSPFLFDFDSLAQANPDFRAPEVPNAAIPQAEPTPEGGS